jgi:hypothetical protein
MNKASRDPQPMMRRHDPRPGYVAPLPPPPSGDLGGIPDQTSSVSIATVQGAVKQLGATAWLLIGGFVATAISVFLTWETVKESVSLEGTPIYSQTGTSGITSGGKFMLLVPIVAAAWLVWPVFAGITMPVRRLIGLSAVVGLMVLSIPLWFAAFRDNDPANGTTSSYGFGLLLFSAAVIAIAVGVVRVWMYRAKTQTLA